MRWLCTLLMFTACDPTGSSDPVINAGAPVVATTEPGAARSAEVPDRVALAELVDHTPKLADNRPTAPDGGTLVGSDSGVAGDDLPTLAPTVDKPHLRIGEARFQPLLSNPATERAARAQIYWPLRACTKPDGGAVPPESIALSFTLRPDGSVDPATVGARTEDQRLEPVAECVVRVFSSIPFRGPAAARGTSPRVVVLWPSVD